MWRVLFWESGSFSDFDGFARWRRQVLRNGGYGICFVEHERMKSDDWVLFGLYVCVVCVCSS